MPKEATRYSRRIRKFAQAAGFQLKRLEFQVSPVGHLGFFSKNSTTLSQSHTHNTRSQSQSGVQGFRIKRYMSYGARNLALFS